MTGEKSDGKPYITLEFSASENEPDALSDPEWRVLETLFVKHPNLCTVRAPYRDPELMEEMAKLKARDE
jgi:hypothetical protein